MTRDFNIDGVRTISLEAFYDEISEILIPGAEWGRNLDAFNDILRGGFGTPEDGFRIRWSNSADAKKHLGYKETVRQLEIRLQKCHPTNREKVRAELAAAKECRGPTVFDWLVEIIRHHGPSGDESEDNVSLTLE